MTSTAAPSPVAIIGAGYLGAQVARTLAVPVLAVGRRGWPQDEPVPPHVQPVSLDLTADDLDPAPLLGARSLVICVAPGRTQDRRALYLDGPRRLLQRWGRGALQRVVWVGSTSALPDRDAWLDERCEDWPAGERGRVQREAEQVIVEHATTHEIPWLVLRLGGLYGPGRGLARLYRRRGDAPLPGDGMAPTNLVHQRDAVAAVVAALSAPPSVGGVVHVVDDDHTPRRLMYDRISEQRGLPRVDWAEPPPPDGVPRGKRIGNARLKQWLGVRLWAPLHRFDDP